MKKLFLSLIAIAIGTVSSFAQDDLVATLSHGSSLSTFMGADALAQAYEAAATGDVITLSPGVFNAVDIEKAITVRGAGMMAIESNGYVSTQLEGGMTINVPSNTSTVLTIEGVQALGEVKLIGDNQAPVKVLKSRFENLVTGYGISMNAYSCIFATGLVAAIISDPEYQNTTLNCLNCVIVRAVSYGYGYDLYSDAIAKIVATNCLVNLDHTSVPYSVFTNCIITSEYGWYGNYPLPETCSAQNCLGINSVETTDLFVNISNPSNIMVEGSGKDAFTPIFKTLELLKTNPAFTETYELTETAAATYLGDDGTQVGIYGGVTPYNPTPTNPQIKKFTVNSTTEGEQLKVRINVE